MSVEDSIISWEELKKHNKPGDYWIVIEGKVYDVTPYQAEHPGGATILQQHSGKDATKSFIKQGHSEYAKSLRDMHLIGVIEDCPPPVECLMKEDEKNFKEFTYEEVKKHIRDDDCWIVIHEHVYNVTEFLEDHPGGPLVLKKKAGKDATKQFDEAGHSTAAKEMMADYLIGKLKPGSLPGVQEGEDFEAITGKHIVKIIIMLAAIYLFYFFQFKE